jgi:hypothetical protein
MTSANKMPTELPEKRGPATLLVPERRSKGWWAGQTPLILAAVLVVSVAVRIVYYVEISGSPLRLQHQWDQTDMSYYDAWARDIAAGDWLSRNIAAPLHGWHHEIAEDHFRRQPAELARFQPAAAGTVDQFFGQHPEANSALEELIEARGKQYVAEHPQETKSLRERVAACGLLWEEWLGRKRFYQEPLYPYLVALTYKVAGFDVRYVFAWQLLLGVLNNVLIYFVARRYFGATAAAVAALLAALCSPLLYLGWCWCARRS